uniref:Sodium/calcium exchanger membrane region domain-containing protein n=1 Tax=Salvator merianae TaxID=96440 RepID=A0A8D0CCY5_SALMN
MEIPEEERRIAELGRPVLGEHTRLEVIIEESYEFKNTVDKLIKKTNLALVVGTNSWREQFIEAITVSAEDDEDDECGEEKLPSCFDYVMHFLTVFWKVLFAFVPPTDYWNGWACFVVSILMIGLLTAFIGDLASHFGCTIGLKDSVTAVVFVALGTSVPEQPIYFYVIEMQYQVNIIYYQVLFKKLDSFVDCKNILQGH